MVLYPGFDFGSTGMHYQRRRNHYSNADWWHCLDRIRSSFSAILHLRYRRTDTLQTSIRQRGILVLVGGAIFVIRTGDIVRVCPAHKAHMEILLLSDDSHQCCGSGVLVLLVGSLPSNSLQPSS